MARRIRHILVAVGDLSQSPKNELRKAAMLAKASGASVELFHAIDEPDPRRSYPQTATEEVVEAQRAAAITRVKVRLERFARHASVPGVSVTCTAVWDHTPCDAIVRRVHHSHADLVVAVARGHRFGARLVLRNTDWELIRHCPVPLLLVKSRQTYQKPAVLAAVDPFHTHAKPADLDGRVLGAANQFARLLRGAAHVFHAYMPLVTVETLPITAAPLLMLPAADEEAHGEQIARVIDRLAEGAGIPRARRHINMGDIAGELSAVTRRTKTGLVVMGAVSRSAIARLLIGSTAERVLDKLACDVLIVKPKGFSAKEARVRSIGSTRRARGARAQRRYTQREPYTTVTTAGVVLPPLF